MATRKQINYALSLMRKLGMSAEWMGSEHKRLGATMRERSGKVENWIQGMNAARASGLIDDLLLLQKQRQDARALAAKEAAKALRYDPRYDSGPPPKKALALSLMRELGFNTKRAGPEHAQLGASKIGMNIEEWVLEMNPSRASELVGKLTYLQKRRKGETPKREDPLASVAKEGKKASEKASQALKKQAPRKEPRGKTARAVAGLPPLKPKKTSTDKPLSRRSTLGTLCERVR